ncbi:MAG: helix-turn-helix domain-containing protein [Faecousia sp.]
MNNTTIGDRIKYHRKRLGMTQEQLAERMGVSAQAVSKWENNLSCPDISVLPELAEVFGISVDELLGKTDSTPAKEAELVDEDKDRGVSVHWNWSAKSGSICFALYILTVGVLLLLRGFIPAMDISWWTIVWTTALVYIGVSGMIGGFSMFCLAMALAGIYFLLSAYELLPFSLGWGVVLPAALLLWGVSLLVDVFIGKKPWRRYVKNKSGKTTVHNNKKLHHEYSCTDGYLRCELSFGECRAAVVTPLLRGGSIDSSFGDFTVDFSACEALTPDCEIDVDNSFGNLTLLVPDKFRVELRQAQSFSSPTEIKGEPAPEVQGTLHIKSDVSFGSMEIRYI